MKANVDLSYVMPFVVNTELGGGLAQARGMKVLQPTEVADAIVEALQSGRVEVWVPKSAKRTSTLGVLLAATPLGGHGAGSEGRSGAGGRRCKRAARL